MDSAMMVVLMKVLCILGPLFVSIAYLTLAERKVLGYIQGRKGPNVIGRYGGLQPLVDGFKLLTKEMILPNHANRYIYFFSPLLSLTLGLMAWGAIPYGEGVVLSDIGLGILYLLAVSSISVYAVLMSGWSSNSKYAFLGGIRGAAQMISYEVSIGLIIISVVLFAGDFNLMEVAISQDKMWYLLPLFPATIMFFVSALAETNRVPFDLTEGESELVSGFNVEYSSMAFALLFLAEYCHIILMSALGVILFLGGGVKVPFHVLVGSGGFGMKMSFLLLLFIFIRGTYPRIRYDQLMYLLWKSYLPLSLGLLVFVSGGLIGFK